MRVLKPLNLRHPADDPRVRELVLRFYEICADFQTGAIDALEQARQREHVVLAMLGIQP